MKARVLAILGALTLAIGIGTGSAGTASAATVNQYCWLGYCMNAWNEGPYINGYTEKHVNNNFELVQDSAGYYNLKYVGPGKYTGECISDYGNSSTDARAGLVPCTSSSVGWGANFRIAKCPRDEGVAFQNVHWTTSKAIAWLTPNSASDNSPFYLNSIYVTCYLQDPAG